jgi:hypothetical protein
MATFVSMMTWHRSMAGEADVRAAINEQEFLLWGMGMHSIIFVSDRPGESAAVLVSACKDHAGAALIAEKLVGEALVRVDSLRFDEPTGVPAWMAETEAPRPPQRRAGRRRKSATEDRPLAA